MTVSITLCILWSILCFTLSFGVALYLIRIMAHQSISISVCITVTMAWTLAFSMMCLLPLDLIALTRSALVYLWTISYWFIFILCWFAIPLQQSYCESGQFTREARLKEAVKLNIRFYLMSGVLMLTLLILLAIRKGVQGIDVFNLAMAMANAWGMLLAVLLLGYGIVEVPRRLWFSGNASNSLRLCHFKIVSVHNDREEAIEKLTESLQLLSLVRERVRVEQYYLESCISHIECVCPLPGTFPRARKFSTTKLGSMLRSKQHVDEPMLANLHYRIKKDVHEMRRVEYEWNALIDDIDFLEGYLVETETTANYGQANVSNEETSLLERSTKRMYFCSGFVLRVISCFCSLLSILVIWCEITLPITFQNLSVFYWMFVGLGRNTIAAIFLASILITYLSVCAFYSMFALRLASYYHLHTTAHSEANSLLFSASNILRLCFPLGLNFFSIVAPVEVQNVGSTEISFVSVMGRMNTVPLLGSTFNTFVPIIIAAFALATYFNMYGRILRALNMGCSGDDNDHDDDILFEGRTLIRQERRKRTRHSRQPVAKSQSPPSRDSEETELMQYQSL